jgi:tetratricopeptide (TPR) repeat protein
MARPIRGKRRRKKERGIAHGGMSTDHDQNCEGGHRWDFEEDSRMATSSFLIMFVIAVAGVFVVRTLGRHFRLTERAIRKAKAGDIAEALAELEAVVRKKGPSPAVSGALGRITLMDHRPAEAEAELRKAIDLGSQDYAHYNALGWALVELDRLDEALPIAETANKLAREDFEVYCLYCGLMAHHGRGAEVVSLFDFLKRTSAQIAISKPKIYHHELQKKFEFASSKMNAAGFA